MNKTIQIRTGRNRSVRDRRRRKMTMTYLGTIWPD
jgi:hypothetical protein